METNGTEGQGQGQGEGTVKSHQGGQNGELENKIVSHWILLIAKEYLNIQERIREYCTDLQTNIYDLTRKNKTLSWNNSSRRPLQKFFLKSNVS